MYKYLANLDQSSIGAVVYTEGKMCVFASEKVFKEDVVLRHYAFLLDFMSVSVDKILFVCIDGALVKSLKSKFRRLYKDLPCHITYISEVGNVGAYDYAIICDAHNVDVFTIGMLCSIFSNVGNFCLFINSNVIRHDYEYNIDLADFLQKHKFDIELSAGENYTVAKYLQDMRTGLEQLRHIREEEERREIERKKLEEERLAEKKRKLVEEKAQREIEELRKKQDIPYYAMLKPYMDWYIQNWSLMVENGRDKFEAIRYLHEFYVVNVSNFFQNFKTLNERCNTLFSDKVLLSLEVLEKCNALCSVETEQLLLNLFNEKDLMMMRLMLFENQSINLGNIVYGRGGISKNEIDYLHDIEAVAAFLALVYPNKHYLFRRTLFERFCEKVGIELKSVLTDIYEYINVEVICENIRNALMAHPSIPRLCEDTYGGSDIDYHLLTYDFISAIAKCDW